MKKAVSLLLALCFLVGGAYADMFGTNPPWAVLSSVLFLIIGGNLAANFAVISISQKYLAGNFFSRMTAKKVLAAVIAITICGLLVDLFSTVATSFLYSALYNINTGAPIPGIALYWLITLIALFAVNFAILLIAGAPKAGAAKTALPLAAISNPVVGGFAIGFSWYRSDYLAIIIAVAAVIFLFWKSGKILSEKRGQNERKLLRKFNYATIGLLVLGTLLFVGSIFFPPGPSLLLANPMDEARSLLGSMIEGGDRTTKVVSFAPGDYISGSDLTERTPLKGDQICMSTGEFPTDAEKGFECLGCDSKDAAQQRLIYHGTANITTKIAIVCNKWVGDVNGGLAADLKGHKLYYGDPDANPDISSSCGNICKPNAVCCAIVLKRA